MVDVGIFSPGNTPTKHLPVTTKEVYICLRKAPPYSGPAGTSYNAQEHPNQLLFFLNHLVITLTRPTCNKPSINLIRVGVGRIFGANPDSPPVMVVIKI